MPLDFSSNDILGLSRHPDVLEAALEAGRLYGTGSGGSPLVSGYTPLTHALEEQVATDKGEEAALVFPSGFQANLSALSALLHPDLHQGHKPVVFCDRLNHGSLVQAVILSGAHMVRYRHNDMNHLETLLARFECRTGPRYLVTESLFGMDGDTAPLDDLATLARRTGAFVWLDEAHATGATGPSGYGLSGTVPWHDIPHGIMSTFSKAVGCSGAIVTCSRSVRDILVHKAGGFLWSTAPSPLVLGAALKAWQVAGSMEEARHHITRTSHHLRALLQSEGFDTGPSSTHIIPCITGSARITLALQERLRQHGVLVSCIRPPSVPEGTSRLRIVVSARHTRQDAETLVEKLVCVHKSLV